IHELWEVIVMYLPKSSPGRTFSPLLLAAGLLALCLPSTGSTQLTAIDLTRINIDITFDNMMWGLAAHDEFADIFYDADKILFYVSEANRRTVPDDPVFAFLGANPGDTVWVLPQ